MAWPFDSPDACQLNYRSERASGCLSGWRGEERTVGALMLVVAIGTFVWMVSPLLNTAHAQTMRLTHTGRGRSDTSSTT